MCKIFSSVAADIAQDLTLQFPEEFDFKAMLLKVGEDAGVYIKTGKIGPGGQTACYTLTGLWNAMAEAYTQLAAALKLHGVKSVGKRSKLIIKTKKQQNQSHHQRQVRKSERSARKKNITKQPLLSACSLGGRNAADNFDGDVDEYTDTSKTMQTFESCTSTLELEKTVADKISCREKRQCRYRLGEAICNREIATLKRKGQSHKINSVSKRVLPKTNYTFSFLSKYGDKNYPSLCKTVRRLRSVVPSSVEQQTNVEKNTEHRRKDENVAIQLSTGVQKQLRGNPMSCDECGKVFHNRIYLLRHQISHTGPQHCCDVCGKMFKIQNAMINHRKTHEEDYTRPVFPCKLCRKTFCSQYILDCHMKSFHMGQSKSYLCSFCGKKFTTKHSLHEHVNAHSGIKPHICEICGKAFSYDSALRDHKFTHREEKQFKCDLCYKSFCQRSGLKMHLRIHRDTKEFQCQECGRGFTQKQALQRHERVHKGVKPFMCKLCLRTFSDASIIRRHLTLVHKIHKDAKSWREDIVCTVQPDLKYHVSYIGKRGDPHLLLAQAQVDESQNDGSSALQTEPNSKKEKLSTKENRTSAHIHPSVNLQAAPVVHKSVKDRKETSTDLMAHQDSQSVKCTAGPRESFASTTQQNLSITAEYLPQNHDHCYIQASSQDPISSLASVSVNAVHSHPPVVTDIISRQGYSLNSGAATSNIEELPEATPVYTNPSTDSAVLSAFPHGPFMQNATGELLKPTFNGAQHQYSSQRKSSSTCPSGIATPTSTATTTTIATPQPLPSLYYYSQLASQFGMNLPEYPYITNTVFSNLGFSPSSTGREHPSPMFPHPQTLGHLCAGVDHSSSLLLRFQGQGQPNPELSQGLSCRDVPVVQDAFSGSHGLMHNPLVVESSRSSFILDSSTDRFQMTSPLPYGNSIVSQKCSENASAS